MKYLAIIIFITVSLNVRAETLITEFPCGETAKITQFLKERYNEEPIVIGRADDIANSLMSLWVNKISGSWTLISTKEELTCVIGTGKDLKVITSNSKPI